MPLWVSITLGVWFGTTLTWVTVTLVDFAAGKDH